jgi:hypothetical protein
MPLCLCALLLLCSHTPQAPAVDPQMEQAAQARPTYVYANVQKWTTTERVRVMGQASRVGTCHGSALYVSVCTNVYDS